MLGLLFWFVVTTAFVIAQPSFVSRFMKDAIANAEQVVQLGFAAKAAIDIPFNEPVDVAEYNTMPEENENEIVEVLAQDSLPFLIQILRDSAPDLSASSESKEPAKTASVTLSSGSTPPSSTSGGTGSMIVLPIGATLLAILALI